ncbi:MULTISPECIES: J domain-containing protein [Sphingomonadales]|uniref:J domain-containing protein n=1 Tax=Sphingomonadales TaxID=204457 RepID=UPI0001DD0C0C|nr:MULTISPECIES: J domain-containing protein [Sphingomonadales]MAO04980.1 molecular chaperone DnaJ [Citromicrobium sp.]ALG59835.1 molecular chaperone DnaJ [Citromicrobium sp. JL477]KPM14026.1 molecular chaperone DnaJ [Citromicrobium sp. JL31]KPM17067.1 molecular chaperone DnaJ [Citromicrobium sp. JL1351]KPM21363.1 molecular chaperone DnaJ [Citromicrobium sp. RCC1885]|tara:strand:- start:1974 stop:2270 length:297 start_codon:yes stop_codon:yes gene_type:complete
MIRFLIIAALLSVVCRWAFGRWPWDFLKPAPTRSQAVFRARKLLDVSADASHAQIIEAHKRLVRQVHPDRGGSAAQVHEANAARDILIDQLPPRERAK